MTDFVRDAYRFALSYRWVIEQAPLQAYVSGLIFAPASSLVKACFKAEEPDWIRTKPAVEADWNACLQTLEGHSGWVESVTFSPNGQRLASGSHDATVKIWDTASGRCLETLEGHSGWVGSVTFSPNGQRLASGSHDATIKIWDTASGRCLETLKGHSDWVKSVTFSPDGQRLASGSRDATVKIWDTVSGRCLETLKIGHPITYILFDYTDRYLLTNVGRITLAATTTNKPIRPDDLERHSYSLGQDPSWITCNGQNVLWLPSEYRPSCSAVQGRIISIGSTSRRVFLIGFSRDV